MIRQIAETFFNGIWRMLLQTDYPGVGVSVAGVMISFFLIRLSIALFKYITGFSSGNADYGRAADHIDRYRNQRKRQKDSILHEWD